MRRALLGAALGALAACGGRPAKPPNVILVTLDTLRADYLSCYDARHVATPAFDALAEDGVRFAFAVSASAVTPVSHATILTGQYPYRHGLRVMHAESGFVLPAGAWYLPAALAEEGYSTAAVQGAFPVSAFFGFQRAFDEFHGFDGVLEAFKRESGTAWAMKDLQRRADATTDLAIEVVDRLAEPFFLWLHYFDPHDTMHVPPDDFVRAHGLEPKELADRQGATYSMEVSFLDREFGRFVDHLRATGKYDDALLVVTADHGEGLEDGERIHGWSGHRMLYREQIDVPLLVRLPPRFEIGRRVVDALVRTADIAPTILDYLGLDDLDPAARETFDGVSLRPLIENAPDAPRSAYAEQLNGYDKNAHMLEKRPDAAFLYSVTDGGWKLVYRPNVPELSELYHVAVDRKERQNRYAEEPEQARRLLADLARRRPWVTAPFPPTDYPTEGREEAGRALDALGYAASVVSDVAFEWTCPAHDALRAGANGRCPECDGPLVPTQARR